MKFYTLVLFSGLILFTNALSAQTIITGQVVNKETSEPIGYVNIGIINQQVGTVSKADGAFILKSKTVQDSVLFSAIGFHSRSVSISEILNDNAVVLTPRIYESEEIHIEGKAKRRKERRFGSRSKRFGGIGVAYPVPGSEIGAKIDINNSVYVKSANFRVGGIKTDSVVLRVNLYQFENGALGRNLIKKNVLFTIKEIGNYSVDLREQNIIIDQDVLLTLEYVQTTRADSIIGDVSFANALRGKENVFVREGKNSKNLGSTFEKSVTGARLGFFITGIKID